jgi:hypothetical protein
MCDMATPHPPDDPNAVGAVDYPLEPEDAPAAYSPQPVRTLVGPEAEPPRIIRLRVAKWDVVCTAALLVLLVYLATATTWPDRLFGFLDSVCEGDTCGPVPMGVDYYIHPVVWGGIGAAIAAAVVGPIVSLLKGWLMSFWPVLSLAIVMVCSVIGTLLTMFSQRYWF